MSEPSNTTALTVERGGAPRWAPSASRAKAFMKRCGPHSRALSSTAVATTATDDPDGNFMENYLRELESEDRQQTARELGVIPYDLSSSRAAYALERAEDALANPRIKREATRALRAGEVVAARAALDQALAREESRVARPRTTTLGLEEGAGAGTFTYGVVDRISGARSVLVRVLDGSGAVRLEIRIPGADSFAYDAVYTAANQVLDAVKHERAAEPTMFARRAALALSR